MFWKACAIKPTPRLPRFRISLCLKLENHPSKILTRPCLGPNGKAPDSPKHGLLRQVGITMRFAFLLLLLVLFLWDTDATRRKIKRKRKKKQPAKKQTASDEGSCPAGQTCSDKYHVDAIQRKRAFGAAVHADMYPAVLPLLCIPMAAICWCG